MTQLTKKDSKEEKKVTVVNLSPFIQFMPPPSGRLQVEGEEIVISGSFKTVVTSEIGGRIFLCGGSKQIAGPRPQLKEKEVINSYFKQMCSPCFEYVNSGLVSKSDMLNYRNSFGLVCLYKLEARGDDGGLENDSPHSSSESNLSISISSSSSSV